MQSPSFLNGRQRLCALRRQRGPIIAHKKPYLPPAPGRPNLRHSGIPEWGAGPGGDRRVRGNVVVETAPP